MNVLLIEINPFVPVSTPISVGYIAAYLQSQGFHTKIRTLWEGTLASPADLVKEITAFQPTLVGISAYQRTMLYVLGLAELIKSIDSNIKIAIGGPQATFMPSEALRDMVHVDYICRSSGETTLLGVAQAIQEDRPFSGLAGVSFKDDHGQIHDTPPVQDPVQGPVQDNDDLDRYPSPYLTDTFDYSAMNEAILLTSRGCPHHCVFCYTPKAFDYGITFHSIERVMEEIRWIAKKGIRRLWFADPNISFRWERIETLLDLILSEEIPLQMWLQTRADLVHPEMMKRMRRAGVRTVAFGLESASESVLTKLNKHISIDTIAEAIRITREAGIEVELFTLFGLPYETVDDALKTLAFVKSNKVKIMGNTNSQQMQIYFGTPMAKRYEEYGITPLKSNRPSYISIGTQYETEWMNQQEMQYLQGLWRKASLDRGRRVVS